MMRKTHAATIRNVTVWRLLDETGNAFGVAATFRDYEYLPEPA